LVTGGAGFIGSHLADALLSEGCHVAVLDNLSTGNISNLKKIRGEINFIEGDIRDPADIEKAAEGCDLIYHEAAVVSVVQTVKAPAPSALVNDIGTINVLDAARQQGIRRVILASSAAVYGDDSEVPNREEMPPSPQSPYAIQKLSNELYARTFHDLFGLETVCLRYFNVFGPRQDPSSPYSGVISIFMDHSVRRKQPVIYGDGNQYRDFVYVKDVVRANLLAAASPNAAGGRFNIGTGERVSIHALWQKVSGLSGFGEEPQYASPRPGDIVESVSSIARAETVLGYRPAYSFDKGLSETYAWFRNAAASQDAFY